MLKYIPELESVTKSISSALVKFAGFTKESDISKNIVFEGIIFHAIINFDITPSDISGRFGLSRATIGKWMSGKAAPHLMVRRVVADWISEQALAKSIALDKQFETKAITPSPHTTSHEGGLC